MNTIIYAQSLQNDGTLDLWYLDKFMEKEDKTILNLSDFHTRNEIFDSSNVQLDRETKTKYIYNDNYILICVYDDKKDEAGRLAPIIIQSSFDDREKLPNALKTFLKKSKRNLSQSKLDVIKEAIKYAQERREFISNRNKIVGGIMVVGIVVLFLSYIIKK
jgi:hypothetical protein